MKKALFTLAAVAAASSSFAQGFITFANSGIPNAAGTGSYNAPIMRPGGTVGAGAGYTVGLFTADGTLLRSQTFAGASGFFLNQGELQVPGSAPGSTPTLTIRAWETAAGSFAAAVVKGELSFTAQPLGGPNPNPALPAIFTPGLTGFGTETGGPNGGGLGFVMVPEPSTYALGVAGLGALAMMRRRKK